MSGGYWDYMDSRLKEEIFGWNYDGTGPVPNVLEDREVSELVYDVMVLLHNYDLYVSGDTCKETYIKKKTKFKQKWLDNRGVRVKRTVDNAIDELRRELYETYGIQEAEDVPGNV